jgi:hypothetical protein
VPTLALILVPAIAIFLLGWVVLAAREGRLEGALRNAPSLRWIGVAAVVTAIGVLVAPRLFGFVVFFLPLLWARRGRRGPTGGPGTRPPRN